MTKTLTLFFACILSQVIWCQDKYILAGDRLFEKGDFLGALEKYKIAQIYNEDYESASKIAQTYFTLQRFGEAQKWLDSVLTYPQASLTDEHERIKCLLKLNKTDEAYQLLGELNQKFPNDKFTRLMFEVLRFEKNGSKNDTKAGDKNVDYCIEMQAVEDASVLGPDILIEWTFDDGVIIRGNKVNHCFKTPGKHSVTLTSIDKTFDTYTKTDTVIPLFFLEALNFEITGLGWTAAAVKFDARKIAYRPNIIGVVWQFGDGEISIEEVFTHKYLLKGNYNVTLTLIAEEKGQTYLAGTIRKFWNVKDR